MARSRPNSSVRMIIVIPGRRADYTPAVAGLDHNVLPNGDRRYILAVA
jgi:hypothetical protein